MTLREFFDLLAQNPEILLFFFVVCPLTALLSWWLGKGEGHISPWKYLYAFLVYLVCIPGIFAVTLNIYLFLFERQSVFDTDIYTQILPIISMVATLMLIRQNVSFDAIPGFGKISAFMVIVACTLTIMWLADRTRIIAISFVPVWQVIAGFLALLALIMLATRRIFKADGDTAT